MRVTPRPARLASTSRPDGAAASRPSTGARPISPLGPAMLAATAGVVLTAVRKMRRRSERRAAEAAARA